MKTKKRRRRTFARQTVAARLELEVHREFIRDCEAKDEKAADRLRSIVREHYKSEKRKLEGSEDSEDPVKELCRQAVAEELAPLRAALGYLADITCKVANLEELLYEIKASDSIDAGEGHDRILQGAFSSTGQARDGLVALIRQQAERLAWLTPIILAQHRLTGLLHVKTGSAYNLLKYVATNPECTPKTQGERRKYLEAMYPTWEKLMRAQEGEVEAEAAQEASHFDSEFAAGNSSGDVMQDTVSAPQLISEQTEPEAVSV